MSFTANQNCSSHISTIVTVLLYVIITVNENDYLIADERDPGRKLNVYMRKRRKVT